MLENLIGCWLPKEAMVIFKDQKPNFVNILRKQEDGKYQILLGTTPDFDEGNFDQFYVLRVPQLPAEEPVNEDNESGDSPEGDAESSN